MPECDEKKAEATVASKEKMDGGGGESCIFLVKLHNDRRRSCECSLFRCYLSTAVTRAGAHEHKALLATRFRKDVRFEEVGGHD
jgi:hypothetical protein